MKQKLHNSFMGLSDLSSYKFEDSVKIREKKLEKDVKDGIIDASQLKYDSGKYTDEFLTEVASLDAEKVSDVLHAFSTGKMPNGNEKITDVLKSTDFPDVFYAASEILLKSRLYPQANISQNLFTSIPYSGDNTTLTIKTIGGIKIEEVAEGSEYPEASTATNDQTYRIHLEIKKYGAKLAATRELINSDNWGIYAASLAQLGDEIAMLREKLCIQKLNNEAGFVLIDNNNPSASALGTATGRGITGAQNGALGVDDIFEVMAYMNQRGYHVDTVVIHPFAWMTWARDPEIRETVLGAGAFTPQGGNAAQGWGDPFGGLGHPYSRFGSGIASTTPASAQGGAFNTVSPFHKKLGIDPYGYPDLTPIGATYYTNPRYSAWPLKIVVSPLVPFYKISTGVGAGKYATNIIFADSRKTGLLLEKESPVLEKWSDPEREIDFVKVRTRFGLALMEQGRSVGIAKNVIIDRTYAFDNVNSVTLAALDRATKLAG